LFLWITQALKKCQGLQNWANIVLHLRTQETYKFHRKFFALLDVAFDAWEPSPVEYKGQVIEKTDKGLERI